MFLKEGDTVIICDTNESGKIEDVNYIHIGDSLTMMCKININGKIIWEPTGNLKKVIK